MFTKKWICLSLALLPVLFFSMGCAVTHPRMVEGLEKRAPQMKKFLVLTPQFDIKIEYYKTSEFIGKKEVSEKAQEDWLKGCDLKLGELGYQFVRGNTSSSSSSSLIDETAPWENSEIGTANSPGSAQVSIVSHNTPENDKARLIAELIKAGDGIVREDLEYRQEISPTALWKIEQDLPEHYKGYDAIIFCYGSAELETDRGFCNRWIKNIVSNILLLPVSVTSFFIPIAIPLTLSTASFSYSSSPDKSFINMVVLDPKEKSIIYQNDYFIEGLGFSDDEFQDIAECLLDDFPTKEQ